MKEEGLAEQAKEILAALRKIHPHTTVIQNLTGVHHSSIRRIEENLRVAPRVVERFIQKGSQALQDSTISAQTRFATNPPVQSIVETLGGETSPLGVRYVLGPDSFREIEVEQVREFAPLLKRQLALTRALLNIGAQFKDDRDRRTLARAASHEVEELELAIRIFTNEVPSNLTTLHRDQRITWANDKTKRRSR